MKYCIVRTNQFKNDFKLAIKQGLDIKKLERVIEIISISKKTIERALNELLNSGKIKMFGAGRSSAYISAERISGK